MIWSKTEDGYKALPVDARCGILKDGKQWIWQVSHERGGTKGGIRTTLREAKASAEHALAHLRLVHKP